MSTPIIRISQLPEETELTISANPANTWFAIVNADVMKTKRVSLETLLKFLARFFVGNANFFGIQTEGGLLANNSTEATVYTGNTVILSDTITFNHAKSSFNTANSAYAHANGAFLRANTALYVAGRAYTHANGAFDKANTGIQLHGLLRSDNIDPSMLYLGQSLYFTGQDGGSFQFKTTNGLLINNTNDSIVNLGDIATLSPQPITINTINGLSGGGQVGLNQEITLDATVVYNHSNSAYNYANTCMVNPAINYITSNGSVAYSNNRYVIIGDKIKLDIQSQPKVNTYIYITNMSTSVNNTIGYSDRPIHGLSSGEDLRLDVPNVSIVLCYVDPTRGWVLV
jgi:hypothetical protein